MNNVIDFPKHASIEKHMLINDYAKQNSSENQTLNNAFMLLDMLLSKRDSSPDSYYHRYKDDDLILGAYELVLSLFVEGISREQVVSKQTRDLLFAIYTYNPDDNNDIQQIIKEFPCVAILPNRNI